VPLVVAGIPVGAMYGLAAVGLILVHRATRNLDLSQGAAATAAAFTMHRLRVDAGVPAGVATAAGLVVAALVGCAGAALARRIGPGRPLAAVVSSLALGGLVLAGCTAAFGTETEFVPPMLTGLSLRVAGTVLSGQQVLVLASALAVVTGGAVALRRTWTGLAWTGLAGDRRAGFVVGLPVRRLEASSYVAAAVLAGAAGMLLAPLLFLDTVQMTVFFLVKPFAAAVVAGLMSLPAALAAGLAIGVAESTLVKVQAVPALGEAVPFALVVLASLPARLGGRWAGGARESSGPPLASGPSRPPGRGPVWPGLALTGLLSVVGPHLGGYWSTIVQLGGITAVLAAAHVVLTGWVGQLSLATPALAGIGAVVAARSATGMGLPFPLPLLAGAAAGALAAGMVGVLLARWARGVLFSAATLTFALACAGALFSLPGFVGPASARSPAAPRIGPVAFSGPRYTWVVVAVAGGVFALLRLLGRSRLGAAMQAVREHEPAAVALGIPAARIRWAAFVVTGALAGVAGALTAFQLRAVAVEQFHPLTALPVLSVAIVGGIESLWGAVLGAALLTAGPELLRDVSSATVAAALPPAVLLLAVTLRPAGLVSLAPRSWSRPAASTGRAPGRSEGAAETPLLVENVTVSCGRTPLVDGMSLAVGPGELVALIGPNGAGKTTLFDAISGFVTPGRGRIALGGRRVDGLRPARRLAAGCGRTFQSGGLFPRLSLRDNVDLPRRWHRLDGPPAGELLAAAGVTAPDRAAADVPPGVARAAELVRLLALRPSVLLLDEPTAGLGRTESDALLRFLRDSAGRAAVLIIEHDLRVVAVTDRVVVMDQGRLLAAGRPDAIRQDPAVIAAYLGPPPPPPSGPDGPPCQTGPTSAEGASDGLPPGGRHKG
jgi:ABC-type branched-subunit amino acid transport system ATPase component/branched-subunit amino acid ABC-type transport system permease component